MEENNKKRIAVFGSTGSTGSQTLEVISRHEDLFEVEILTAQTNASLLIEQALKFNPNAVVIGDESKYEEVKAALTQKDIQDAAKLLFSTRNVFTGILRPEKQ